MNENNNMNNNYTNNPAPEQPAGDNMYQETTSQPQDQNTYQQAPAQDAGNMYHYNEQGTGQYQQPAQNSGQQYNTYGTGNQAFGGYQYTDSAQQLSLIHIFFTLSFDNVGGVTFIPCSLDSAAGSRSFTSFGRSLFVLLTNS